MAEPEEVTQRLGANDRDANEPTQVIQPEPGQSPEPTLSMPSSPWAPGAADWAAPDPDTRVHGPGADDPTTAYPPGYFGTAGYPGAQSGIHNAGQPGWNAGGGYGPYSATGAHSYPPYGHQGYRPPGQQPPGYAQHSAYQQAPYGQHGYQQHPGYYQPSQYYYQPQPTRASTKRRWPLAVLALVAAFLLAAGGFAWASRSLIGALEPVTNQTEPATQPSVPSGNGGQNPGRQGGTTTSNAVTAAQSAGVVLIEAETSSGTAAGTGMILSANGLVLTNYHVVAGSEKLAVTVADSGDTYVASVLGFDQSRDVALLQLQDANGLTTVTFDDDSVSVGDEVAAVGNASGGGELVKAAGEVTSLDEDLTVSSDSPWGSTEDLSDLIETDAGAVPGDSGGPMFDAENEVIGMTTAGSTREGTSYAVPIATALSVVEQIQTGQDAGTVRVGPAGYLGIKVADAERGSSGKTITEVVSGSPADEAGVTSGSRLTKVGDTAITARTNLATVIRALEPGSRVTIEWTAPNGTQQEATVTLGSSPVN